jgi:hypothetical protein
MVGNLGDDLSADAAQIVFSDRYSMMALDGRIAGPLAEAKQCR